MLFILKQVHCLSLNIYVMENPELSASKHQECNLMQHMSVIDTHLISAWKDNIFFSGNYLPTCPAYKNSHGSLEVLIVCS